MSRIFITGSTEGIGRAAARSLLKQGHEVVLHARSKERASAVNDLAAKSAGIVIGDLRSAAETRFHRRASQCDRTHGRRHPQRRYLLRTTAQPNTRRASEHPRGKHARAVYADRFD